MKTKQLFTAFAIFAFSINLFAQQRVVLIEQFTNSGCPPCASASPQVFTYVDNHPSETVCIAYHTSFPYNDSMYFENPIESNARVAYYNVMGVPNSILDGNVYQNSSSTFLGVINTQVTNRLAVAPKYDIASSFCTLIANQLSLKFNFLSLANTNATDTLRAHIVVIEKAVQKNAYLASPGANSETQYKYVMRKMLPNANGFVLQNRNLNEQDSIEYIINLAHIKSLNEVRVIAFVQNNISKEIYNAALFTPTILASVPEQTSVQQPLFQVFPNPSSDNINIRFNNNFNFATVELIDVLGSTVYSNQFKNTTDKIISVASFTKGIYFLKVETATEKQIQKIIIH